MQVVLLAYPLSRKYRLDLENMLGEKPLYLTIADLRSDAPLAMVRRLLKIKAETVLIPIEDASSSALLPLLMGIAAFIFPKIIKLITPEMAVRRVNRVFAAFSLVPSLLASFNGIYSRWRCDNELKSLLKQTRQKAIFTRNRTVVYLKTNLWFGVKAGGSVGHVAGVTNALARRNKNIIFLGTEYPVMVDAQIDFKKMDAPAAYGMPSEVNLYRFQRQFYRQAKAILSNTTADFIYQRLSLANYSGVQISRELGVPLVVEYNGSEAWVQKNWGTPLRYHKLAISAEKTCLKHAHVVVTISDVLKDELIKNGVPPNRIVTYPNCIEPTVFNADRFSTNDCNKLRKEYGIDEDSLIFAFIGTFGQWHGVEVLAEAIRKILTQDREFCEQKKIHFLLIGDGAKFANVSEMLSIPQLRDFVTLTGLVPQDQAPIHLAMSNVLLSPHVPNADGSKFFGSPTKLFEYMAMGKPIIASNLDQIGHVFDGSPMASDLKTTEQLPEGSKAILIKPGSVDDLLFSIKLLADAKHWHKLLGRNACEEALSKYTWDIHVRQIYDKLIELSGNDNSHI